MTLIEKIIIEYIKSKHKAIVEIKKNEFINKISLTEVVSLYAKGCVVRNLVFDNGIEYSQECMTEIGIIHEKLILAYCAILASTGYPQVKVGS